MNVIPPDVLERLAQVNLDYREEYVYLLNSMIPYVQLLEHHQHWKGTKITLKKLEDAKNAFTQAYTRSVIVRAKIDSEKE